MKLKQRMKEKKSISKEEKRKKATKKSKTKQFTLRNEKKCEESARMRIQLQSEKERVRDHFAPR